MKTIPEIVEEFEAEWSDNSVSRTARLELKKQFINYLKQALQQQRTELLNEVRKGVPEEYDRSHDPHDTDQDPVAKFQQAHNFFRQQLLDHLTN